MNKDNALILDLSSEYASYASVMENNEVPWVWNMLHAFGGKPGLEANVETISQTIPSAYENYDYMTGIGITPESFSRCPMIYDLLCEMTWTKDPVGPMEWGEKYLERRYGGINDDLSEAWNILLQTAYDCRINDIADSLINVRPREKFTSTSGGGRTNITYDVEEFEKVLKIYLDNYEEFKDSECFIYDLSDIARQVLQNSSLELTQTTETSYTHEKVKTGKEYTYRVTGLCVKDEEVVAGVASDEVKASASLQGEVELSIAPNGTNKFDLAWTGVEGATRYIVYRKASDAEWKKILTLGKDARNYTSNVLKANTYSYMVKAARYDSTDRVMTNGSNVVDGMVEPDSMKPTNVKVESVDDAVVLTWDKVVGMTHYEIYRSKDGGAYRHVKTTNTNTLANTTLKSGSTYRYKIRAYVLVNGEKVYSTDVESDLITIE